MNPSKKLILVIGATGAQGVAVIDALIKPASDGSPSPYAVRALTRNIKSAPAQTPPSKGAEVVAGSTDDLPSVLAALKGVYGAFINTDSFTIGEQKEVYQGIRIFELAKQLGTLKHYVYSSLDNVFKLGNFNPKYYPEHYTGKSRVADWMRAQDSVVGDNAMSWSVLTTGPYMDMLNFGVFGPLRVRPDGTHVFASPMHTGHVPMIALSDLGVFARHIFDHRDATSAQELKVASDWVAWPELVATFTRVTGRKAEFVPLSVDAWCDLAVDADIPLALDHSKGDGSTTWRQNTHRWFALYQDELIQRDFAMLRKIHPGLLTVEQWMRNNNYTGEAQAVTKASQAGQGFQIPDPEKVKDL
ncbi:nmrA-family protein [Epithele typhae]|uniref:nmrA-family protein n=1 Tax=Epithele typhae TaxID=378194 RepID=UPI002007A96C|nr:nmrA-family protein [Epithele typhae]KAH9940417.1 nmrA-family protein [Epithele typhae]